MSDDRGPTSESSAVVDNVVSIVRAIEQKQADDARHRAAKTHLRQAEAEVQLRDLKSGLEELDLDGAVAEVEAMPGPEARSVWVQLRSLRALQRCMVGDPEAGLAEWAEVIAAEPTRAAPYLMRAHWLRDSDVPAALDDLCQAVAAEPRNPVMYAKRADCHRALGDLPRAIADYRRAVSLDPTHHDAYFLMGVLLVESDKPEEALAAFDAAIRLAPRYVEFYTARAALRRNLNDLAGAIRDYERVVQLDPSRNDIRDEIALLRGDVGKLKQIIDTVVRTLFSGDGPDLPEHQEILAQLGTLEVAVGRQEASIRWFSRALALVPTDVVSLTRRGRVYYMTGAHERALYDADAALALEPEGAGHHVDRAFALGALERWGEAVAALSRVIDLDPTLAPAYRFRGVYRSYLGDDPDTVAAVEADLLRAFELAPDDPPVRREYIAWLLNHSAFTAALSALASAFEREPVDPWCFYARGYATSRVDEEPARAEEFSGESAEDRLARWKSALSDLERALDHGHRDEEVYFETVCIAEVMGDDDFLLAMLERALDAFPEHASMRETYRTRFPERAHARDLAKGDEGGPGGA